MSTEPLLQPSDTASAFRQCGGEPARIFDELPKASIVSVSRPETGEISPILLSYTIELQYKQAR
jgi:phospholipase D1/2